MSILDTILEEKTREIAELYQLVSIEVLREQALATAKPLPFAARLTEAAEPRVIAEIKRASPSRGWIRKDLEIGETALGYAAAGAVAISVLTDRQFFNGDLSFLPLVRSTLSPKFAIPLLRKDFIIDPIQIWQSRAAGADAVLLIAAALDADELVSLTEEAVEAQLDVLFEVHDEDELSIVIEVIQSVYSESDGLGMPMLGINNRDLKSFSCDLRVTERLSQQARTLLAYDPVLSKLGVISESGITTAQDLRVLREYGATAYLIGESLVAEGNPGENLQRLRDEFGVLQHG